MNATELLRTAKVSVSAETYTLLSLTQNNWQRLLQNPELSPRMSTPFMIFFDGREVTLLLDEKDFAQMRDAVSARREPGFRLVTFDIELDFAVVGFMAEISRILAGANIPIIALSSYSRDHLLIKQADLANALKALGPYVGELC